MSLGSFSLAVRVGPLPRLPAFSPRSANGDHRTMQTLKIMRKYVQTEQMPGIGTTHLLEASKTKFWRCSKTSREEAKSSNSARRMHGRPIRIWWWPHLEPSRRTNQEMWSRRESCSMEPVAPLSIVQHVFVTKNEFRSPLYLKSVMRDTARQGGGTFALAADVTEAHRQILIDP